MLAYELLALGVCIKAARLQLLNADIILPINTSSCSVIELTYLYSLMGGGWGGSWRGFKARQGLEVKERIKMYFSLLLLHLCLWLLKGMLGLVWVWVVIL